jgi:hypothetical protein
MSFIPCSGCVELLKMKNRVLDFCLIVLACLSFDRASFAQHRVRRVDTGIVALGCFTDAIKPISQIPPLRSDMPPYCRRGYLYFDSLCRTLRTYMQVDSLITLAKTRDSLRQITRFLYSMSDYDDDLLEEYRMASYQMDTNYRGGPGAIYFPCLDSIQGIFGYYDKRTYFVEVPVILHIHVVDLIDNDTLRYSWPHELIECATAKVVESLKGKHVRTVESSATSNPGPFIHISYFASIKERYRNESDDSSKRKHTLEPGNDYVVFLENEPHGYDGHFSYYNYLPYCCFSREGGIFPIDSTGNVQIPSNYFGYGTNVPLATFEADLRADIQSIVSH